MGLSTAAKNAMLDELASIAAKLSLHSADPGATGASELAGGSYTREDAAWNPAAAGNLDLSNAPVFDVPALSTVAYWGMWTAGGAWLGGQALSSSEVFTGAGTYTLLDADVTIP